MLDIIFPTPVWRTKLPNHDMHQEELLPYLYDDSILVDKQSWNCNVKTSLDSGNNNKIPWSNLINEIVLQVKEYTSIWQPYDDYDIDVQKWMCRYDKGSYQEQHNHANKSTDLSCVYLLKTQNTDSKVVFVDPRQDFYKQSGFFDHFANTPTRHFTPEQPEGTLIIFPSNLDHYVTVNSSDIVRGTVSMNFKFKFKNGTYNIG